MFYNTLKTRYFKEFTDPQKLSPIVIAVLIKRKGLSFKKIT